MAIAVPTQFFALDVAPHPKERPRMMSIATRVRTYTPPATVAAENAIRWLLRARRPYLYPMPQPLSVYATFSLVPPATTARGYPISGNRTEGDVDQYAKLLMDACTGLLWDDDNQVVELTARKVFAKRASIDFTVSVITD